MNNTKKKIKIQNQIDNNGIKMQIKKLLYIYRLK